MSKGEGLSQAPERERKEKGPIQRQFQKAQGRPEDRSDTGKEAAETDTPGFSFGSPTSSSVRLWSRHLTQSPGYLI